jgi:hypothetical protein
MAVNEQRLPSSRPPRSISCARPRRATAFGPAACRRRTSPAWSRRFRSASPVSPQSRGRSRRRAACRLRRSTATSCCASFPGSSSPARCSIGTHRPAAISSRPRLPPASPPPTAPSHGWHGMIRPAGHGSDEMQAPRDERLRAAAAGYCPRTRKRHCKWPRAGRTEYVPPNDFIARSISRVP